MPDVDQLFQTLNADVETLTRAPGAPAAIRQARRRRQKIAAAGVAAVAGVALGGGLALGARSGDDRLAQIGEPPPTTSASPSFTAPPGSLQAKLGEALGQVPNWAIADRDATVLGTCSGFWAGDSGGNGGMLDLPPDGARVWTDAVFFPSPAEASKGLARLVENVGSCTTVTWRTQPIGQTDAVLASSNYAVVWILRKGDTVTTLQVPTLDGPPPLNVQVAVADLMRASIR